MRMGHGRGVRNRAVDKVVEMHVVDTLPPARSIEKQQENIATFISSPGKTMKNVLNRLEVDT